MLSATKQNKRRGRRREILEKRYLNPGKGINVYVSEQYIDDKEGSGSMNSTIVESGGITKRFGWERVGLGLTNAPRGLASYYPTGAAPLMVTVDGDTLKYLNTSVWTALPAITFSTAPTRIGFVQAQGRLFIWNGVDAGSQLSGTTLTRPTTTIKGGYGIYYADKQIVSGVPEHPNRLYISSPVDVADFTNTNPTGVGEYSVYNASTHPAATTFAGSDANYLDVARDDGDRITGLAKYTDKLIIFKERAIYSLQFDTNGLPIVSLVTSAIGCVSHWSIDQVDNDLLFLSRNGYYVFGTQPQYFDQLRTNELSIRVRPFIKAIKSDNLNRAAAIWYDNTYYCSAPVGNSNTNNRVFTYHRQYTAWLQSNAIAANAFTTFIDSGNNEGLYYADDTQAQVWKQTSGYTDDGEGIDMFWESKAYDLGKFDEVKRFIDFTLLFRQLRGSVKVTITIDGNRITKNYTIPGTSFSGGMGRGRLGRTLLGGKSERAKSASNVVTSNIPIRLNVGENGRTIKVRVQNSTAGESFVLLGYNIGYRPYGRNNFPAELRVY